MMRPAHFILPVILVKPALKGGLPTAYLHTIFKKFALIIEDSTSHEYLRNILTKEMALEYTSAVVNFTTLT